MKNNKSIPSIKKSPFYGGTLLVYGELWILLVLIPFFYALLYGIWRNYYNKSAPFWIYLIIAIGSTPAAIRFFLKPLNLFGEGWLQPRTTAMLTDEERKALTFLKTSKIIKKKAIIVGVVLFVLILIFPTIRIITNSTSVNSVFKKVDIVTILSVSFLYYIFSHIFLIFLASRYLITHWDKIQQMPIEPWPKDKPYSTGPFRYRVPEEGHSFIADLLSIDPNTPFNWHDFVIILAVLLSIGLIFWGVGAIAILFSKISITIFGLKLISFIIGIAILSISVKMWYKEHKSKQK